MKDYKVGINARMGLPLNDSDTLRLIKNTGFDAFFIGHKGRKDTFDTAELAAKNGLIFQSIHAPFGGIDCMWKPGEAGQRYFCDLKNCIDDAHDCGVPIVVVHPYIGFTDRPKPNLYGVDRFKALVAHAEEKNVTVAFENVEGEEFLDAVMKSCSSAYAAFCWDTGHEMCYNRGADRLSLYGNRLAATHFNDNFGISSPEGIISPDDDLHLLPYDGTIDWTDVMRRIRHWGYDGIITFEIKLQNKPNDNSHDKYHKMSPEEFMTLAYERAKRVVQS